MSTLSRRLQKCILRAGTIIFSRKRKNVPIAGSIQNRNFLDSTVMS
jgi:hypothetical protein